MALFSSLIVGLFVSVKPYLCLIHIAPIGLRVWARRLITVNHPEKIRFSHEYFCFFFQTPPTTATTRPSIPLSTQTILAAMRISVNVCNTHPSQTSEMVIFLLSPPICTINRITAICPSIIITMLDTQLFWRHRIDPHHLHLLESPA